MNKCVPFDVKDCTGSSKSLNCYRNQRKEKST